MLGTLPPATFMLDEDQRRASAAYAAFPIYSSTNPSISSRPFVMSSSSSTPTTPPNADNSNKTQGPTPLDNPDFYVSELQSALYEISFGVKDIGNIVSTSGSSLAKPGATAEVALLEGRSIKIKLTLSGYKVMSTGSLSHGQTFETIESLMEEESPLWRMKRVDKLMAQLTQLAGLE